jgi:alkylation response protein AidB-like acyl-CoA dehydrogenase
VHDLVVLARLRGKGRDLGLRRRIADLYVASRVQALAAIRVSDAMASGKLNHGFGGALKLGSATLQQRRAELGLELAGTPGVTWREDDEAAQTWAHQFLSSRSASIAAGTNEIHRNNVAERALGLPRETSDDRELPFNEVLRN